MVSRRRREFVYGYALVVLVVLVVLSAIDALSLDLYFSISFVAFLVLVESTAPFNVTPRWRSRLRWLIALGFAIFVVVIVRRVLSVVPSGVF